MRTSMDWFTPEPLYGVIACAYNVNILRRTNSMIRDETHSIALERDPIMHERLKMRDYVDRPARDVRHALPSHASAYQHLSLSSRRTSAPQRRRALGPPNRRIPTAHRQSNVVR